MTDLVLPRRQFIAGLFAAPAIVRIESIMPVKLVSFEPIRRHALNLSDIRNILLPGLRELEIKLYQEQPNWKLMFQEAKNGKAV